MKFKKVISSALALMLAFSAVSFAASANELTEEPSAAPVEFAESGGLISQYYSGGNINAQNYRNALRWSVPINSYLASCSNGQIMRFQNDDDYTGYLVEYYDQNLNRVSSKLINKELELFGGFYSTDQYYFLLTGQTNSDQDDSEEVFRITKFDKNWNRISSDGLCGANTVVPFDAGCPRMTVCGNYLLVRASHKMYKSSDGYNHQANVTIEYDMTAGKITDSYTDVMNSSYGYVSHSFNQFIKTEDNKIVAVDHGDAYPRSIALIKYQTDASTGKFVPSYYTKCQVTDVVAFPGSVGANDTGASIGGFEISDTNYLVAGNQVVDSSSYASSSAPRNVFVAAVSKSTGNVTVNNITNFSTSDSGANNPQFVKIADNSYLLMWSKKGNTSEFYYTKINASGQQTGSVYTASGALSDCVPTVINNKITWYVWNNNKVTFYQIPVSNLSSCTSKVLSYDNPLINESYMDSYTVTAGGFAWFRAKASGGSGVYTYSYYVKKADASSWTWTKENVTNTNYAYGTSVTGEYIARIVVTDSDGKSTYKEMRYNVVAALSNKSSIDKESFAVGGSATITGAASGGSGSYSYEFYYKRTSSDTWTQFGSASSATLKPSKAGEFDLKAVVKDTNGSKSEKTFKVTVLSKLTNKSTVSAAKLPVGKTFTVKGAASGGNGNYNYEFYYKRSTASGWKKFGSENSASLKPSAEGDFDIRVYAKDTAGNTAVKNFKVTAYPALENKTTISASKITVGKTVTVKGAASGGQGSYTYEFYYKRSTSSKWTKFGSSNSASLKPSSAGTFNVRVYVKDTAGNAAVKNFTVTAS